MAEIAQADKRRAIQQKETTHFRLTPCALSVPRLTGGASTQQSKDNRNLDAPQIKFLHFSQKKEFY
jgi:hypothetical protein